MLLIHLMPPVPGFLPIPIRTLASVAFEGVSQSVEKNEVPYDQCFNADRRIRTTYRAQLSPPTEPRAQVHLAGDRDRSIEQFGLGRAAVPPLLSPNPVRKRRILLLGHDSSIHVLVAGTAVIGNRLTHAPLHW